MLKKDDLVLMSTGLSGEQIPNLYQSMSLGRIVKVTGEVYQVEFITGTHDGVVHVMANASENQLVKLTHEVYRELKKQYQRSIVLLDDGMAILHHDTRTEY